MTEPTPPAEAQPVNETAEMLHWQIEHAQDTITALTGKIEKTETELAEDRRILAEQEAHLRRMTVLAQIVAGRVPLPTVREIEEYGDGSVRIGPLVFNHPGPDASEDEIRFFAASMRRIYEVTTPVATRAIGEANLKRHQAEQADVPTGQFRAVQPTAPAETGTEVIQSILGPLAQDPNLEPVGLGVAADYPHRVMWDHSAAPGGVVCAEPRGDGRICGMPVESEPCHHHAPADLDQVAANPAVTTPDGQERTDG